MANYNPTRVKIRSIDPKQLNVGNDALAVTHNGVPARYLGTHASGVNMRTRVLNLRICWPQPAPLRRLETVPILYATSEN